MLLILYLLGALAAVRSLPRVDYRIAYLNPDTGEFGGNLTINATPNWFLKLSFPSPGTQIKHSSGPVEVNHYQDGSHVISLRQGFTEDSVTVNFVAICSVVPSPWDEVLIAPPTLYESESKKHDFVKDQDFFIAAKPASLAKFPTGAFLRPMPQLAQLKSEEGSEARIDLSPSDRASLEADGTYLVGTQLSFIIYCTVFLIGGSSYAFGSLLRLKHRKRFRTEKLRRARNVQGYSQII